MPLPLMLLRGCCAYGKIIFTITMPLNGGGVFNLPCSLVVQARELILLKVFHKWRWGIVVP